MSSQRQSTKQLASRALWTSSTQSKQSAKSVAPVPARWASASQCMSAVCTDLHTPSALCPRTVGRVLSGERIALRAHRVPRYTLTLSGNSIASCTENWTRSTVESAERRAPRYYGATDYRSLGLMSWATGAVGRPVVRKLTGASLFRFLAELVAHQA